MSKATTKFKKFTEKFDISLEILTLPSSTRTAAEAAQAVGCQVAQIAKSIIFKTASGKPILVIASGVNQVDEEKLTKILKEKVQKADADFVKENTGYTIGGVPPFGHIKPIKTFIDKDLFNFPKIWAAAGDAFSIFKTTAEQLKKITNGEIKIIKKG